MYEENTLRTSTQRKKAQSQCFYSLILIKFCDKSEYGKISKHESLYSLSEENESQNNDESKHPRLSDLTKELRHARKIL